MKAKENKSETRLERLVIFLREWEHIRVQYDNTWNAKESLFNAIKNELGIDQTFGNHNAIPSIMHEEIGKEFMKQEERRVKNGH